MTFLRLHLLQIVFTLTAASIMPAANAGAAAPTELPREIHSRIVALSQKGDGLAKQHKYASAIQAYTDALKIVPLPIEKWEASTWLLVAIGDAQFLSKNYVEAKSALTDAMRCPGAIGNPFIHLRLGQAQFELGNMESASDELARAYLPEGVAIFGADDPKYLRFIKSKLKPPPGGWPAGW